MPRRDPRYEHFIQRLAEARVARNLTQAEVATRLGRPQSFVSKCETGERRVDVVELMDLAALYGRSLDWFVR
jgi:transcriptional regulator with XRE-family HTH domain